MKGTAAFTISAIPAACVHDIRHRLLFLIILALSLGLPMLSATASGRAYASEPAPKDIEITAPEKAAETDREDDLLQPVAEEETPDDGKQITCTTKITRTRSGGDAQIREEDSSTTIFLGPMTRKEAFERAMALAGNEIEQEGVAEVSFICEFSPGAARNGSGGP